jgi:hypothetical protein
MFVSRLWALCILVVSVCHPLASAAGQVPNTENVTAVFSLPDEVAAFDAQQGKLTIYTVVGGALQERVSTTVVGNVWQVTASPTQYVIATGMGKNALDAPIRVLSFSRKLEQPRELFSVVSERAEVPFLKWQDAKGAPSKVWIAFFDSKYTTKIGFFNPTQKEPWTFNEVSVLRMGTAVDAFGDLVVVGRPYGDIQGQDGDLLLLKDGQRELLPSYRGVRAVRLIGDPHEPSIFVADGWHQNYGQMAQGRVSLLRKDASTGRYALQIVDKDDGQYGFSKFVEFMIDAKRHVAALGPRQVVVYGPEGVWKRTVVYSREREDSMMDMALVQNDGNRAWIAVVDKGLRLVPFP